MTRSSYARDEWSVDVNFHSTILITNPLKEYQLEPDNIGPIFVIFEPKLSLKCLSSADMVALANHPDLQQITQFISQFTKYILLSTRFSQREQLNWQINKFCVESRVDVKVLCQVCFWAFTTQPVLQTYQWRNHSVQTHSDYFGLVRISMEFTILSDGKKTFKTNFFQKSIWLHLLGFLFSICQIIDYRFGKTNSDLPSNAFSEI